jgi:hypothetical protein
MANLIKPGDVKIITKNNEIFVNLSLELNIKLDGSVTNLSNITVKDKEKIEDEKVAWQIPDFSSGSKINFGKES